MSLIKVKNKVMVRLFKQIKADKGISTSLWGSYAWNLLFYIVCHYKVTSKIDMQKFFILLKFILPCCYCRSSYTRLIAITPVKYYTKSRCDLMYWLFLIKNNVNLKLGKKLVETFNKKSLSSGNYCSGFNNYWPFLFAIAANYNRTKRSKYLSFYNSLAAIHPDHSFKMVVNLVPVQFYLGSSISLLYWTCVIYKLLKK